MALSQDEIAAEIDRLQALLSSGATQVLSDGEQIMLDQAAIRRRIAELQGMLTGKEFRSRRVRTLDISGAF